MQWFYTSVLITIGVLMFKVTQGESKGLGIGVIGNIFQDAGAQECKHNVASYGNKEFSFHSKLVTWRAAKGICETACGGFLAQPETKEENDFLAEHIHTISDKCNGGPGYWFGLHRVKGTKKFAFIDKGHLSYSSWIPGEPTLQNSDNQDEECGLYWCRGKWNWNDGACESYQKFICEKSVSTTESLTTMATTLMSTKSSSESTLKTTPPETMTTRLKFNNRGNITTNDVVINSTHDNDDSHYNYYTSSGNTMSKLETTTFPQTNMSISTSFQERIICKGLKSKGSAKDNVWHFRLVIFVWVILSELV